MGILLVSVLGCSDRPAEVLNTINLVSGELASLAISTDEYEGYFDDWSEADVRLQMGWPDSVAVEIETYRRWLSALPIQWPEDLSDRANGLLEAALGESGTLFPGLAPDTIELILTDDLPYGASIYFTRGRAIICPKTHLKNASEDELMHVFRHELFHLISRNHIANREEMYDLIGFKSIADSISWPGHLYDRRLLNPDAPRPDYALDLDGILYVPVVYAAQSPYDADEPDYFARQLRFKYFQMRGDSLRPPTLSVAEVRAATGGLTNYIIHPEEILADQFALLLEGRGPHGNETLEKLSRFLRGLVSTPVN